MDFYETMSYFNRNVSKMDIEHKYKVELLGLIIALGHAHEKEIPQWIPCSERMPEEDHWLGGSGRQFSEKVMVTIVNHSDEDKWVDMTYTIDGEWACELPKYCKIVAWMPSPECYREGE